MCVCVSSVLSHDLVRIVSGASRYKCEHLEMEVVCLPCDDDERPAKKQRTARELQKLTVAERTCAINGIVWGVCSHCTLDWRRVDEAFVPKQDSSNSARRAHVLMQALKQFAEATDDAARQDLLQTIIEKRTSFCSTCISKTKLSPAQLACKTFWEKMKYDACLAQNGCPTDGCAEKGMASWIVLQADHIDPSTRVHSLGEYKWWSWNGGVDAMREERKKVQFICGCCHRLRPTSAAGQTVKEKSLQWQKDKDMRTKQKEDYVNARKLDIGCCQYADCGRAVTPQTVRAFDFDHREEHTKATHETMPEFLYKGKTGVSGLVNNMAKRAALEHTQSILDAEMDKCDLLCHNCHVSRKNVKRARWDASFSHIV